MNKRFLYSLLLMAGGLFVSCDPDKVDDIDFDVNLRNNAQEVYVGDEVVFDFSGNPDYIVFYSGEELMLLRDSKYIIRRDTDKFREFLRKWRVRCSCLTRQWKDFWQ